MIEIWQKCASFQMTSQRLADQVRTIIKTGTFSDLEILEIHTKIDNEHESYTAPDTSTINKNSLSEMNGKLGKIETPHNHKRTTNNSEQALTQEQKVF